MKEKITKYHAMANLEASFENCSGVVCAHWFSGFM